MSSSATGTAVFATSINGASVTSVSILAGSSTATFYYGDTKAGTPTITAATTGLTSATQVETINAATANKLAITSATVSGAASNTANLGPITVQLQDTLGNPVTTGTSANLSSNTTGTAVFATSINGASVTSVSILAGSSTATFYYGDTKAGTPTITAATTGLTSATQVETINAATANKLAITSATVSGAASNTANLGPITVQLQDTLGNPVTTGTSANLSSNTTGTAVFATSINGASVTSVSILAGSSTATFYYGDTKAGTPTITAATTGLTSATQVETINAGSAASVSVASGSGQSATVGTTFGAALVARITDANGNPISGALITFTAPASGASGTFGGGVNTATTNTSGLATSANFTANATFGNYLVSASIGATSTNFTLTNAQAGTATTLVSTSTTAQVGQSVTFTATVAATGTPVVPVGSVSFLDSSNGVVSCTSGSSTLDATGKATCTTSFAGAGTFGVKAAYAGNASFAASTSATTTETISGFTTISSFATSNKVGAGSTQGRIESGDSLSVTFSGALNTSTLCSAWTTGTSFTTTASVHVSSATPNVVTIDGWNSSSCGTGNFGTIDMGSGAYVTSPGGSNKSLNFTGSVVTYDATSRVFKIVLGSQATGGTEGSAATVPSSTAAITLSSTIKDSNGYSINPLMKATGNVAQF